MGTTQVKQDRPGGSFVNMIWCWHRSLLQRLFDFFCKKFKVIFVSLSSVKWLKCQPKKSWVTGLINRQDLPLQKIVTTNRSSHQRCSVKKGVLKYFAKFTGKHLCQSLFFYKDASLKLLRRTILLKKRLWHRCFPVNFAKFLRTHFLQNTSKRLLLY